MSGVLALLQEWLGDAERLATRLPDLAGVVGKGSWPAAALAGLAGLALLVAGARLGRLLAGVGGALVGWLTGNLLAPAAPGWVPATLPAWVAAAVLGGASFFGPGVYPVVLGLVPGALLGLRMPVAGSPLLGGLAGGLVLSLAALWARRLVLAATAALAGAALVVASLLALSRQVPALLALGRRPTLVMGLAAVLAVAGTAFQLGAGAERGRRAKARGPDDA